MIGKTYLALGVFIIIMLKYIWLLWLFKNLKKTKMEKLLEKSLKKDDDLVNLISQK